MAESRFKKLFTDGALTQEEAIAKIKNLQPEVTQEEEQTEASNLRNILADKVNPILPEALNIPKMTQADEVRNLASIPEQIGMSAGAINVKPSAKFGNLMQITPDAEQALGKVATKPTMADLVSDTSKFGMKKELGAAEVMRKLEAQYGPVLAERKAAMKKGLITPDAYNSFKQEMVDKIRRGE